MAKERGGDHFAGIVPFVRVAEARSFTGAAKRLGLTPSAVSKAIAKLEGDLGVALLHRTSRSVTLTPEGAAFYERCRQIVSDIEEARESVSTAQAEPRGHLRVSLPLAFGRLEVMPLMPGFLEQNPELTVDANLTDRAVDLAEEGYDVAVRIGRRSEARLVARRIRRTRMVTAASPAYLRERGVPERPEALRGHNCVGFLLPSTGALLDWVFEHDGRPQSIAVRGNLTVNTVEAQVEAAVSGGGVIQTLDFIARRAIEDGTLVPLLEDYLTLGPSIFALYPENRRLSAKIGVFIDFLTRTLGEV
ncbi:LysR family transcriptional regulator [Ectothiorhodospiraceae bacterium WFHF3C12]|nr:LysR family transcriptional regulator [Ectothiorhodospiraceae bacterium WFHF3C12]